ncbi:MAG: hypothetical protein OES09_14365 [Gammaproteobacteria bacterium]|nr:hypothetical protein [Gammaproteobacteria bacterium]
MSAPTAFAQKQSDSAGSSGAAKDRLTETRESLTDVVRQTANVVDNFFSTERHSWQNNKTRVTVRGNLDWLDEHGWDIAPDVRIHLALPGLDDRLRLVVNDDDESEASDRATSDDNESNVALRFIARANDRYGITFDLGASTRGDPSVQGFVRANFFRTWQLSETWDGRLENRLYWYNDSKWRNDVRWYFERLIGDKFFFRARSRLDYQEDKDSDWYPEQRFTLFQQISDRSALAYEVLAEEIFFDDSPFDRGEILKPDDRFTHFQARLRFRQNIGYPWLFYEIWPIAWWTEERDYEFTPSIRFRLEVVLGDPPRTTRLGMN